MTTLLQGIQIEMKEEINNIISDSFKIILEDKENLKNKIKNLQSEIDELKNNSIKDVSVEFENCKKDLEYFQNKCELQETEIHNLEDKVQEARNKFSPYKKECEMLKTTNQQLLDGNETLEKEIDALKNRKLYKTLRKECHQYKKLVYDMILNITTDYEIDNLVNKGLLKTNPEDHSIQAYCDNDGKYPINP